MFKIVLNRFKIYFSYVFFFLVFSTSALATTDENGAIIDNNTFDSAYSLGYWQYHPSTVCRLPTDETEAYLVFNK